MWALGCILYELCNLRRAFQNFSEINVKESILSYNVPQLPLRINEDLAMIYRLCMQKAQSERPTVSQIL
ncbi:MAG: protein kinase [Flammeovirgaceae bacterium]